MKQPSIRDVPSPFRVSCYEDACELRLRVENCYPVLSEGTPHYLQYDPLFWDFYKVNKDALRAAKVFVTKEDTRWILKAYPLLDPAVEKQQKLDAALDRWRKWLTGCCVPFEQMGVIKRHMRANGRPYYNLWCPKCKHSTTSALPFVLVKYLVEVGLQPKVIKTWTCAFCGWSDDPVNFSWETADGESVCLVGVYRFFGIELRRTYLYDKKTGERLDCTGTGKHCESKVTDEDYLVYKRTWKKYRPDDID